MTRSSQFGETVFVVEWASGGGFWVDGSAYSADNVYLRQGSAMAEAFVADLHRAGFQVRLLQDSRANATPIPNQIETISISSADMFWKELRDGAEAADWFLVIAPECAGWLQRCHVELLGLERKSLSPTGNFLNIAASKHATSERLRVAGVQRLVGEMLEPGCESNRETCKEKVGLPAILKPDDGAGGERLAIRDWSEVPDFLAGRWRIESLIDGVSVSIAAWVGPAVVFWTEPVSQRFSERGAGEYLGGEFPLDPELAARTKRLAKAGMAALGPTQGYVGLDIVLADDPFFDAIVDVNPRLTCSYIGLRQIYATNLAAAIVQICRGEKEEFVRQLSNHAFLLPNLGDD